MAPPASRANATNAVAQAQTHHEPTIADEFTNLLAGQAVNEDADSDATLHSDGGVTVVDEFVGYPWWRRPSVYWLIGPYLLFTLAFGGVVIPKINLILDLICRQYFNEQQMQNPNLQYPPIIFGADNPQCENTDIQKRMAFFTGVLNLVTGTTAALVVPRVGHLSDRYGRTRLLALASCGGLLNELITVLAGTFPNSIDYRWLVLGAFFDGITGSFTAGSVLTQSYASDCTLPSKRAVAIGYIHACLFMGMAFGPLLAGQFIRLTGQVMIVFYVVMACHLFFILFTGFVIPDSLSEKKKLLAKEKWRLAKEGQHSGIVSSIRQSHPLEPFKALWPEGPGTSSTLRVNLVALAFTDMVLMGAMVAIAPVLIIYTGYVLHWGTVDMSMFVSAICMVRVVVLLGVLPAINYFARTLPARRRGESTETTAEKRHGADRLDLIILRFALLSDVIGSTSYIFARNGHMFYASGLMTALGGMGSATIGSIITKHIPQSRVGQTLGAVGMLHALARVAGPLLFNALYYLTVDVFPQAIFVLLASLFGIALLTALFIKPFGTYYRLPLDSVSAVVLLTRLQSFGTIPMSTTMKETKNTKMLFLTAIHLFWGRIPLMQLLLQRKRPFVWYT